MVECLERIFVEIDQIISRQSSSTDASSSSSNFTNSSSSFAAMAHEFDMVELATQALITIANISDLSVYVQILPPLVMKLFPLLSHANTEISGTVCLHRALSVSHLNPCMADSYLSILH
jgi:hypothetical protein